MPDLGITHIALTATDRQRSCRFYELVAGLEVVDRRAAAEVVGEVVWLANGRHNFVLVLIATVAPLRPLVGPLNHLGVACASRDDIDRRTSIPRSVGARIAGPHQCPPPVGYWVVIDDPDGHGLEFWYGQHVEGVAALATIADSSPGAE